MMSFILPLLKISPIVRDAFIETLRKAMTSRYLNVVIDIKRFFLLQLNFVTVKLKRDAWLFMVSV